MLETFSPIEQFIEEAFKVFIIFLADKVSCLIRLILDFQIFWDQKAEFLQNFHIRYKILSVIVKDSLQTFQIKSVEHFLYISGMPFMFPFNVQ